MFHSWELMLLKILLLVWGIYFSALKRFFISRPYVLSEISFYSIRNRTALQISMDGLFNSAWIAVINLLCHKWSQPTIETALLGGGNGKVIDNDLPLIIQFFAGLFIYKSAAITPGNLIHFVRGKSMKYILHETTNSVKTHLTMINELSIVCMRYTLSLIIVDLVSENWNGGKNKTV